MSILWVIESNLRLSSKWRIPLNIRFPSNRNLVTRSEWRMGASNWIGATRAISPKKGWIRPSGEDLGRGRNKTDRSIVPRWNKNSKNSGWDLGRDSSGRIQSMIPRRK
jgi:hypothetical protein